MTSIISLLSVIAGLICIAGAVATTGDIHDKNYEHLSERGLERLRLVFVVLAMVLLVLSGSVL